MACLEGSHAGIVLPEMESTLVNRTIDSPAMGAHDVVLGSSTVELSKEEKKKIYQRAYRLRKQIERLEEEKRQLEQERDLVMDTILELYKPDYFCKHCRVELESNTMEGMCADCFWDTEELYRGKPLQFTVYENGTLFPVSQMTTHEAYAIQCEVEQIVGDLDAFDVELNCGEEVDYGIVKCSDPDRLMKFAGNIYRIQPKQYGLSPWAQDVQIRFETILTTHKKPLEFAVYRGTHLYPLACMFDDERLAIQREVKKIVGDVIEVDVLLDDENAYRGVVKCSDPARLMEFQGKTFKITPEECHGLSWGDNMQIKFETILTEHNDDDACGCDGEWGGCGCGPRDYCLNCEKEAVKGHDMCKACEVKYNTQCYACVSKDGMLRHICE